MHRAIGIMSAAMLAILLWSQPADALIERVYSLQEIMDESSVILEGKIAKVDANGKAAILTVTSTLKGKTVFRRINANIRVGQVWHPDVLMTRLKPDQPVLVFYSLNGQSVSCLVHTDGIFFQLFAEQKGDPDKVWWQFTHIELMLRRTYDGPTQSLTELVKRVLAGRAKPPAPNAKGPGWTREELLGGAGSASKLVTSDPIKAIFSQFIPLPTGGGEARGVAWGDYDNDGDWDALVCAANGVRLHRYSTSRKQFIDETANVGLRGGARCASWLDYNLDGRPDLLLVPSGARTALWRNDGGRFTIVSSLLPDLGQWNLEGAGPLDANGDGRPDILLTNGDYGNCLLLSQGGKSFRDVSSAWGLGPRGLGVANGDYLAMADYDCDGWPDFLYNVNGGLLARNDAGATGATGARFRHAADAAIAYVADNAWKLGASFGDFDNDGDMDLFVPQQQRCRLYRNESNGTFTDITYRNSDLTTLRNARTSAWADFNNDGLLDLVVGFSDQHLRLFVNDGTGATGRFAELSEEGLAPRLRSPTVGAAGLAFADFDADGDLDLLLSGDGGTGVLLNTAPPRAKPARAVLRVRPVPSAAPGAIIRLYNQKDQLVGLRQLGLVQNFSSQEPPEAFFAIAPGSYRLSVLLTDGQVVQTAIKIPQEGLLWQMQPK